jgi:cobalt-zinc-cadmium resistance protein CzcA
MLIKSIEAALEKRWMVLGIAAFMTGLGIWAYTQLHIDAYPDISGVQVQIITPYPGRAAEEVEQQITIPLERAMASIPHHEAIRSRTIFGLSVVQIIFDDEAEDYWARNVVFQKIGDAGLPADAQPGLGSLSTAYGEIYRYNLVAEPGTSLLTLRELNDWVIKPRLYRASGVAEVANFGGLAKQYAIHLDQDKLIRYGVNLQDVLTAIQSNNSSGGGSLMDRGGTSFVIRGLGRIEDYRELSDILVKNSNGTNVFVRDVGSLEIDHMPQTGIFGKDKVSDSVEGIVIMRRGENPSETLENIKAAVEELNNTNMPRGVTIVPFYNRTSLIESTLHTVIHNTVLGITLVIITLFFFLKNTKISMIVALTIPISLLFALLLMKLTGIPISLLSVGAIDFGIIVDGAIIVSENIIRRLAAQTSQEKQDGLKALILGASSQVQKPMIFSMMIVIMAYIPLLSLRNIEGLLFRPMAITMCFAFLGALLTATYLVPVLASFLFKSGEVHHQEGIFDKMEAAYAKVLPLILKQRKAVIAGSLVVLFGLAGLVLPRIGTEFLPYMDEGNFWIRSNWPEGISLKENASYTESLRRIVSEFKEVSFVTSQVGRNDDGTDPFPTNRTEMMVGLKDRSEWKDFSNKMDLEAAIRGRLQEEFPTTKFNLTQPIIDSVTEDTNGTSADLAVELVGTDLKVLRELGDQTEAALKSVQGSVNVGIEQEGPQPQLQITIDKNKLAHYQLAVDAVNNVINTAVGGLPVSQMFEGDRRFDILVKYRPSSVSTPQAMALLPVFTNQGEAIPLGQVAKIRVKDGQTIIARTGGKRRVTVRCDIRGRSQGEFVDAAKEAFKSHIKLPQGYEVQWMGMFENLDRARTHFGVLIPITLGVIFLMLLVTFGSFKRAGLVLMTLPYALIGGIVALYARDMHLSVSAGVGLTSLFGVATMHGVILVSYLNQLYDEGMSLDEAIIKGACLRIRPVMMTVIVAILGLIPASMATGIGSDVQRPIATVVVWGLMFSALVTLFVIPALYRVLEEKR